MPPTSIIPFSFDDQPVRVTDCDGSPWFVLTDVCAVLELANPRQVGSRLDDDEKGVLTVDTPGGAQETTIINESGLWSLVLTSRKPEAKAFKKWITSEVIPSIRKTGSFGASAAAALSDPATLQSLLLANVEKVLELQAKVANDAPKLSAFDLIATADGSMCVTDAAKALQVRPKDLFGKLQVDHWIYRRTGGKGWLGYQAKVQSGLVEHKVDVIHKPDGTDSVREQVRITPKGLARLAAELAA